MLEILAPAGNAECANAAIDGGANAIYLGLEQFSARQGAGNFDGSALHAVLQKAHLLGVKVYVAMNTIVKNEELTGFFQTLVSAWNAGVDAIILQDIFLGKLIHERYPAILLHLSTQAGVCNVWGAKLAKAYGFERVILARETPIKEIAEIAKIIETEAFVQGALCTCFSGQCYFSSFVGGNSGNRGRCKQPCRKLYAYDRGGNEEKNYALSLSDLSVGGEIEKLIAAGVTSFKIEGRMRRAEYVAAAVRYYKALLENRPTNGELSDLKRTYNRGNYTRGLAFGQDKRLLSTAIQGHIGEKVGVVKVVNGKFLVESTFKPQAGDAFKILRDGKEVAGATYAKTEGKCFALHSKIRLKNGDGVFVTTDSEVNARLMPPPRTKTLSICLYFHEGEPPVATCGDLCITGETLLQSAQNRPLGKEELVACFQKVDGLPIQVEFALVDVQGNSFLPKSELNAFRRSFYAALTEKIAKGERTCYAPENIPLPTFCGRENKTAVITDDCKGLAADIVVYKPKDLRAPLPQEFIEGTFEKYLYYPAFATSEDLSALAAHIHEGIDGIYAENYGGIAFAKAHGVKVFAGTGFNLINALSVQTLLNEVCVQYYALSKEGNAEELKALGGAGAFVLSSGDIKLMDLCYCPFGKTCAICDKKQTYRLTDEGGRNFPVRRYLAADGSCRFEVYNCASLIGTGIKGCGQLLDLTVTKEKQGAFAAKDDEEGQKRTHRSYTSGHYKRGVL